MSPATRRASQALECASASRGLLEADLARASWALAEALEAFVPADTGVEVRAFGLDGTFTVYFRRGLDIPTAFLGRAEVEDGEIRLDDIPAADWVARALSA